jgi:microcystin degradation protein MlrC
MRAFIAALATESNSFAPFNEVLSVGHRVPADEAFRHFAGHNPDPTPLHRRFGLLPTP